MAGFFYVALLPEEPQAFTANHRPNREFRKNKICLFDVLFHKIKSYLSLIFSKVYAFSILNTLGFIQEKNSTSE